MIFATLVSGHADLSDFSFLIAVILAIVSGVLYLVKADGNVAAAFLAFAVGAIALGLLVT